MMVFMPVGTNVFWVDVFIALYDARESCRNAAQDEKVGDV